MNQTLGYSHELQNCLTFILLPQFSFLTKQHFCTVAVQPLLSPRDMDSFISSDFLMGRMVELSVLTSKYKRKGCERSTGLFSMSHCSRFLSKKMNKHYHFFVDFVHFFSWVLKQKDKTLHRIEPYGLKRRERLFEKLSRNTSCEKRNGRWFVCLLNQSKAKGRKCKIIFSPVQWVQ